MLIRSSRESSTVRAPCSSSRQLSPVSDGLIPAPIAVLLTWKSFGPVPIVCPRGASRPSGRKGPPIDCPAPIRPSPIDPAATLPTKPRREIVAGRGAVGALSLESAGSGTVCSTSSRSGATTPRSRKARAASGSFVAT